MADSKNGKPQEVDREEFKIRDQSIIITKIGDREVAQVDGCVMNFYKTPEGYLLTENAFQKPAKTLRAAIKRYLEEEAKR